MKKKLWFTARSYGWGWTPASWEGWLAITIYFILFAHIMRNIIALADAGRFEGMWMIVSFGRILLITIALLLVCYLKGEKPHWNWKKRG